MIETDLSQIPALNNVLIEVLVCPRDQADLQQHNDELVCVECGRRYLIENGVPNMLIDLE
jgi:uncharacterized protein YbaR (Trm112 family)